MRLKRSTHLKCCSPFGEEQSYFISFSPYPGPRFASSTRNNPADPTATFEDTVFMAPLVEAVCGGCGPSYPVYITS